MVDILKIKDENGDWVTVQAFQGQTGLTPHIQIGQVEAGATPSDAAASMSGTKEFPLLNLTLPKGDAGLPGIAVQSATPSSDQLVWIDTSTSGTTTIIPEINDTTVSSSDTWSSSKIRDFIYPVGSIYLSVNNISPATIFGGTWEQIQDTFLLAAGNIYTAGSSGGEATHTLTINEMPSHKHTLIRQQWYGSDSVVSSSSGTIYSWKSTTGGTTSGSYTTEYDTSTQDIQFNGGDQAHNNMPPYLAIYVWKRTA